MGKRVRDFSTAKVNANRHSARGIAALDKRIRGDGWIGAMTTAADGEMIAGSARLERVADIFGVEAEPLIIETVGDRPVVIVRKDIPNAADPRAQRLSLADNRIHQLDLAWDVEVLAGYDAAVLEGLYEPAELSDLGQAWANAHGTPVDDPQGEWQGMPEFEEEDLGGVRRIIVHFMTHDDVREFQELIGQGFSKKQKYIWHPKAEILTQGEAVEDDQS